MAGRQRLPRHNCRSQSSGNGDLRHTTPRTAPWNTSRATTGRAWHPEMVPEKPTHARQVLELA
eukprot:268834-Alexandrium_andersonii.AAC.1